MNREENIIKKSVCSYDNFYLIMGKKKKDTKKSLQYINKQGGESGLFIFNR